MTKQKIYQIGGKDIAHEDLSFFEGKSSEDTDFFKERLDISYESLAKRNQAVIDRTVKKYKEYRAQLQKNYDEGIRERSDAVSDYLKHLVSKDTPVENYFGRTELARLQGRRIMSKIFKAADGQKAAKLYEA